MPMTTTKAQRLSALPGRIGWLVILTGALWVSGFSLYWLARTWGVPIQVAVFFSASYDGVALLAASYALGAVRDGASDRWPRFLVISFAGCSAWLNSQHAVLAHEASAARLAWAVPPIAAAVAYDLHTRSERRKALVKYEATYARPAPHFGAMTWLLFPLSTIDVLREIVKRRRLALTERETAAVTAKPQPERQKVAESNPRKAIAKQPSNVIKLDGVKPKLSRAQSRAIREWWRDQGNQIGDRGTIHWHVIRAYYNAHPELASTAGGP